ncbi:uncharacterized protein EAE97_008539 [Botrytis byssoidea]|uniref:Cytochrome P450 n=1 Tax=Botrytis byssoidea TaxID=139641 RepID=A0A9P5I816_9HELO|nr:uncharacterized protein EAE97_008539 [Botrytis byssoidea]KAF7934179.1 hypothetical protein EAE97_008539 [Botrytis byssoidea]
MEHAKQSKLLERWANRFEQFGDTFAAVLLGNPMIATIDQLNVQTMLGSNFKDYGVQPLRRSATLPFLGEGVFTMDGSFWQHPRTLMRPTFTRANVANLPSFEKNLQKFFKLLPEDGSTVDLKPLLCKLFIDTSTEFLFGESMDMLSPEQPVRSQEFLDAFHYGQFGTGRRLQLGKLAFLYRDKKYYDSIKLAHAFADFYVDKAIEYRADRLSKIKLSEKDGSGHKYVLLLDMAMQTDNRNELRSQILHVFLAGHESSAITIGNALFQLSQNPSVWGKLRQENVIKETLRLYPVASIASRKAYKDGILPRGGGPDGKSPIFVRKGTVIITPLYSLHRLVDCFQPDGDKFFPFLWEDPSLRPGEAYIPFGWGIRTCPAQHLAEIGIAYTLARMAQKWKYLECRDEVEE